MNRFLLKSLPAASLALSAALVGSCGLPEGGAGSGQLSTQDTPRRDHEVLSVTHDTWFKFEARDSSALPDSQRCALEAGQRLDLRSVRGPMGNGHFLIVLSRPLPGCRFVEGYVYEDHVEMGGGGGTPDVITACRWFANSETRSACFSARSVEVVEGCKWFANEETRRSCFRAWSAAVIDACKWFASDDTRQACFRARSAGVIDACKWFASDDTRQACFRARETTVVEACKWFASDDTRQACFWARSEPVVQACKWFASDGTRQACFRADSVEQVEACKRFSSDAERQSCLRAGHWYRP